MIKNKTELQKRISEAISGYRAAEVIHALEIIKLDVLLTDKDGEKRPIDNET